MSPSKKIAYSIGNLGGALSYQAVATYVQFFYLDVMKLAPALMAPALIVYAIWNAINEPLSGHLSDHTRSRWGRRIPYILFLSLPLSIFLALVFLPPVAAAQNQTLLFSYFLFAICLFDGFHTIVTLNLSALLPEMFPTLKERAQVSSIRQVFGIVGSIIGIALPPMIYTAIGWGPMGIVFGVITGVTLYVSLAGARERGTHLTEKEMPLKDALAATFKNKSFIVYMAFQIMLQFSFLLITAAIPFYTKYVLREDETKTSLLLLATFVVAILTLYAWSKLITRIGARRAMMAAFALFALTLMPLFFVNTFEHTLIATSAFGIALAGLLVLPDIMLSDVIDEDEQNTGRRREGMYFGMQGLLIRTGIVLQALALNATLTASGYDANLPVAAQPAALETGLRYLVSVIPSAGALLGIVFLKFYPLDGARLAELQRKKFTPPVA